MLIAPIFQHNYLAPNRSGSTTQSNKPSDTSSSASTKSNDSTGKYNNIFKTAFNIGSDLIKNTFLSKINGNSSNSPASTSSVISKQVEEPETIHDSDSSPAPSDCSSPDSLKSELIFFKPIIREPKTPSLPSSKHVVLRVPSIRSAASSTDPIISSPCPSPFFIPIAPRRESAFSVVGRVEEPLRNKTDDLIIKPKATKRRTTKASPESASKRIKQDVAAKTTRNARRPRQVAIFDEEPKKEIKTERKTRSMDKKQSGEGIVDIKVAITNVKQKQDGSEFKSPTKAPAKKRAVAVPKKSPKKSKVVVAEIKPMTMTTRSRGRY